MTKADSRCPEETEMIRCRQGHFICSVQKFYDADRRVSLGIADGYCKGCDDWVALDFHDNMVRMRDYVRCLDDQGR